MDLEINDSEHYLLTLALNLWHHRITKAETAPGHGHEHAAKYTAVHIQNLQAKLAKLKEPSNGNP